MSLLTSNGTTKRKKRKTRKCLDEMRKSSKNAMCDVSEQTKLHKSKIGLITSRRLTLKPTVLSKSIKSETVSRASLHVPNTSKIDEGTPLAPPTPLSAAPQGWESEPRDGLSPASGASGASVRRAHTDGYGLYAQLMRRLMGAPPGLPQEDAVIAKIKANVQQAFIDNCGLKHSLVEDRLQLSGDSVVPEAALRDPMEYLRQRGQPPQSPAEPTSSSSSSPTSDSGPLYLLQNTPEYKYYPRKLNQ